MRICEQPARQFTIALVFPHENGMALHRAIDLVEIKKGGGMVEALAIAWGELQHALAAAVGGGGGNHAGEGRLAVDGGHYIVEGGTRVDHDQLLIEYQGPPTGASEAGADGGVLIVHIPLAGAAVARQA